MLPKPVLITALVVATALMASSVTAQMVCPDDRRRSGRVLVVLEPWASIDDVLDGGYPVVPVAAIPLLAMHELSVTIPEGQDPELFVESVVDALDEDPAVDRAEAHRDLETPEGVQISIPDLDITYTPQQYLTQPATTAVNSPAAQAAYTGAGVRIAVIDTGMAFDHPITSDVVLQPGADYAGGDGTAATQANALDDDGDGLVDESEHHATFVAGLIKLVAPQARILPVRTLECDGRGSAFALAQGIIFAMQSGVDVINISESMQHDSRAVERAIEEAIDAGIVVVVAAGNDGADVVDDTIETGCVGFPANMPEVIAVAAVDANLVRADFSNYGPEIDLSAPGVDLLSAHANGQIVSWGGTSFAAPLVAGAVALLLEKYPGLTPLEVEQRLRETAQPDNNPPELEGRMGAGVLDVDKLSRILTTDRTSLRVHRGDTGSVLTWSPVLGATTYDAARGDVSNLAHIGPAGQLVDLGPLTCLLDDAPATDTLATPDGELPLNRDVFFYLFRDDTAPGYGTGSGGDARVVLGSDCSVMP